MEGRHILIEYAGGEFFGVELKPFRDEYVIQSVRKFLPAGILPDGSVRQDDILQFFAVSGGLRTVRVKDIMGIY